MNYEQLSKKKKMLDVIRQRPDDVVRKLNEWFCIELTYTSNAIEGNRLSREETALIVEKGLTIAGKSSVEHMEAVNHAAALDWIYDFAASGQEIKERDILQIQHLILKGIDNDSGQYRRSPVKISGSAVVLPSPFAVPDLIRDFIEWLRKTDLHPVELAAEAHYHLVTIHPFTDGNGRSSRLLMNLLLIRNGYPPAIIRTEDREAYIASLEKAQLFGDKADYMQLIAEAAERSLDIYLEAGRIPD
ncbi:MAG: Fic family protein [Bacteroidota bacterium]